MPPKDIKKKISLERPNPSKQVWEQDKKKQWSKIKVQDKCNSLVLFDSCI